MKIGDLVRVNAPIDRYMDETGRVRRSITLWDNERLAYGNGRFPNKSITADDIMVVLDQASVIPEGGHRPNHMVKVLTAREGIGWILEENLEVIS
jgi:hypothetical protein